MRRLGWLMSMLMLLLAAPVHAAQGPVEITGDQFTIDQNTREATFVGKVVIHRGTMTIWADRVVVLYGAGGQSDIESLLATGNVRIKMPDQDARGDRATYDPKTLILVLSQNVTVSNAQGTVSGPELTINLANDTSVFKSDKGSRVTGVFTPQ